MSGETWFLASCVELYKTQKHMTGREAWAYLRGTGAADFIIDCWDGLHMTGPLYILDSIDEYITAHGKAASLPAGPA